MTSEATPRAIGDMWKVAGGGVLAIVLAAALGLADSEAPALAASRVLLTFGGALTIGIALYLRPGHASLYALACGAAILARFAFPAEWDSMVILTGLAAVVAGVGAILTALPTAHRKVAASVLVVLHFAGILCAVTAPPSQPWVSNALGVLVYRPYLQSIYMTNAYHFYSPEPGPASQVWFCIKYKPDANGVASLRWDKFPRRPEHMTDPLSLSYYRRLSLTMQLENTIPSPITDDMKRARAMMALGENGIRIHPGFMPLESQYRMPANTVRDFLLPSYVRHVAKLDKLKHDDGVTPIDTIRVYRVEHRILAPSNLQFGDKPYDPTTYMPYYMGEFDSNGKMVRPYDPLLYWMIPIIWEPRKEDVPPWHTPKTHPDEFILVDCLIRHNGGVDHN